MPPRQRRTSAPSAASDPVQPPAPPRPALFLRTKLLPPRPVPSLLPRPRLSERLLANLEGSVTLVTANAGSGKTTLVADFVREHAPRFAWYQLDATDADPFLFLGYLTTAIRQVEPDFGDATLSYLRQQSEEVSSQPERAVDVLINEIVEGVDQRIVLVLDDYHHLGLETPVHRAVDRLLAYLPDVVHLIVISRDTPPLALARLRSRASLAVIGRDDLLFTDEETQALFRSVFGLELTPELTAEYRERTHGWITALQLVRQVAQREALARDGRSIPDLGEVLRQSERDIFDYFAEEVFAGEREEVRTLLLRASLLDRVELDHCSALFPKARCSSLLPELVRRNVFVTVASDERGEEYRIHPLFRDFLRRRLRSEIGREAVAADHRRFAEHFLARGHWERGVRHLSKAGDDARIAEVIAERGGEWIAAGTLASLLRVFNELPQEAVDAHPRAILHGGEVMRLQGDYEAAKGLFRRAAVLLRERGDAEGEAEALHSLASIARREGGFAEAFELLDRAGALAGETSAVRMKCGNTRGLCLVALGQYAEAEGEFRAALGLAEERGDDRWARLIAHNLGTPAGLRGDFLEALRWLRRMLAGSGPPFPQEATAHLNIARCLFYRGETEACERHLDLALERCQLFNLSALRGEVFETYGNLYRDGGDVARAEDFYERAAKAYRDAGIEATRRDLLEERSLLRLAAGDLDGARGLIERQMTARTRSSGDERDLAYHVPALSRGRILLAMGETEAARRDLEPAATYFHAHGHYFYEAQASLALAACDAAEGHEPAMHDRIRRAIELSGRYDYEAWLKREIGRSPELFGHSEVLALLPPDLRALVPEAAARAQVRPAAAVASGAAPVVATPQADLTINLLGPVEIFRDPARRPAPEAWVTRRARDILCFIASRRHRRASKDSIIDTFWGEADFASVEKNFHPTVSHIRKALNSNQAFKQNFVVYRDGDYMLNPDLSYRVDVEEFDRLVAEGEAARRGGHAEAQLVAYEAALELVRGEFMQGSYDDWVEEQRSYYTEQALRLLEALAHAAMEREEWPRALDLAQRILRGDGFREDIHRMAMRAHAALGNRMAVKEQYEHLRKSLRAELGVEPERETTALFRELVQ